MVFILYHNFVLFTSLGDFMYSSDYVYYLPDYVSCEWREVDLSFVVKSVLSSCPFLDSDTVISVLKKDGDGRFFDFEVSDWVEYFKEGYYLN